jgi:hypothetical protein
MNASADDRASQAHERAGRGALIVTLVSARPEAGDLERRQPPRDRLRAWSITGRGRRSIVFVEPGRSAKSPYPADQPLLYTRRTGQADRRSLLFRQIAGASRVPRRHLQVLQATTGLVARQQPDRFCYLLTSARVGSLMLSRSWFDRPPRKHSADSDAFS